MGLNTFLLAVIEDNEDLTQMLLQSNHINTNYRDCFGRNALHYAAANGSVKMAATLIRAGVDLNSKNNALETPLMKACQFIELDMIRFLLELPNVDVNCRDLVASRDQTSRSALDILKIVSSVAGINSRKREKVAAAIQYLTAKTVPSTAGGAIENELESKSSHR